MARVGQKVNYYNFSGGKVSDYNPLSPPENVVRTLLNVDVRRNGTVSRRLGLEPEGNFDLPYDPDTRVEGGTSGEYLPGYTLDELKSVGFDMYSWTGVDFNPDINFLVVRIANQLLIYRPTAEQLSGTLLKIIDISEFITNTEDADLNSSFQAVSGKGLLVCSGGTYTPFYIKYDSEYDTWTVSAIEIRIRDFEGVVDGFANSHRPAGVQYSGFPNQPPPDDLDQEMNQEHWYNLLNQGWAAWEVRDFYWEMSQYSNTRVFPSNSDIAALGRIRRESWVEFQVADLRDRPISTGVAPKGHFIIDPFNEAQSRSAEYNKVGFYPISVPGKTTNKRPKAVAFYAGRFWYGSVDGVVYYSQLVEGVDNLGRCYQEQDPTAEDFNQLLDTDGGTLKVLNIGTVEYMVPMGNHLIIMGTSGIYALSGGDRGFTANQQQLESLSKVPTLGYKSVVTTNGPVVFWSDRGIFAIGSNEIGSPTIQSVSDNKVSLDYDRIPIAAKMTAQGCFEPVDNRIYWSYNQDTVSLEDTVRFSYTNVMVLDLNTGAFWDYQLTDEGFESLETTPYPFMTGTISSPARLVGVVEDEVTLDDDEEVTLDDDSVITVRRLVYGDFNSQFAAGAFLPDDAGNYYFTFAKWSSREFKDWERLTEESLLYNPNSYNTDWPILLHTSGDYSSIVETLPATLGEPSVKKQSPYVYTYYQGQREGYPSYAQTDPPAPVERFDDEWWWRDMFATESGPDLNNSVWWWEDDELWGNFFPLASVAGGQGMKLDVIGIGDNMNWTADYRPASMNLTVRLDNPGPGLSGSLTPDMISVVVNDNSGGWDLETNPRGPQIQVHTMTSGVVGAHAINLGFTDWNQTVTVNIPLYFRGDDPETQRLQSLVFIPVVNPGVGNVHFQGLLYVNVKILDIEFEE